MKELDDLVSILKHRGFCSMKLQRGYGYRDLLRMDQHFERAGRDTVAMRVTIWDREGEAEGFINVYEIGYRRTSGRQSRTEWRSEKRYTSPQAPLNIVIRNMPALIEEAMADVNYRLLSCEEQAAIAEASLTPEQRQVRARNEEALAGIRERMAASIMRVNMSRRKGLS